MPVTLPSDALDQILSHVDDSSDVLNVAVSNKILHSVAIPQHLHYRDIRSRLNNPALWTWLSRFDDLRAAHIRSLTILPDQNSDFYSINPNHSYDLRERLPPDFIPAEPIPLTSKRDLDLFRQSEASLVSTLKRMSCLERFRWYRLPRPLLDEADDIWTALQRLGTVKEIDIYDGNAIEIQVHPVVTSDTFLRFGGLTTIKLRSSACGESDEPEMPPGLEKMLLDNVPDLEVLVLELDLNEQFDGTANIDNLLSLAHWPKLRVLRLRGVNCRVAPLVRFLAAHHPLEHLALAQMMPGHAWTQLESELPSDALPNLRHLECSSSQAAALLKSPHPSLETLLGVEVHDTIIEAQYFTWDDEWEDEDHDDYDGNAERTSPWRAIFTENLKAQRSITRLGVISVRSAQEIETLSILSPQIKELDIGTTERQFQIPDRKWHRLFSLFPSLQVIQGGNLIWFDPYTEDLTSESVEKTNIQIQALTKGCPKLRLILVGLHAKKAVIIRAGVGDEAKIDGVRWVVRRWTDSETEEVRDGERVYGP